MLHIAQYILLAIIATFGSSTAWAGSAPVPNAGYALLTMVTYNNTVFKTTGTPNGLQLFITGMSYILFSLPYYNILSHRLSLSLTNSKTDLLSDWMATILNVTGDMTVCGIIALMVPMEEQDDEENLKQPIQQQSNARRIN